MEAAIILLSIGAMIGLMGGIPTLANGFAAYLKARAERDARTSVPNDVEERLRRLEVALAETRDLAVQHMMSVDKNVDILQSRLSHMEKRSSEPVGQSEIRVEP